MEYIDLLLDNGELIRIEHKDEHTDLIWEDIENTMKRGDWLPVRNYEGCTAKYLGVMLDCVNMKRVIATL